MTTSEISFSINSKPIAKMRPRLGRYSVYDPQNYEKIRTRVQIMDQFNSKGYLNALQGAIAANVTFYVPMPNSWSHKRKEAALGSYVEVRADIDNFLKFYFDVMNGLAYKDDSQIVKVIAEKIYSIEPSVEINLYKMAVDVINEHAITYKNNLSIEDIDYIAKKANRLGLVERKISRTYQQEDADGTHVYFEVDGLKERNNQQQ